MGKAKLRKQSKKHEGLNIPADYRIGIVPASDTGAVEMAMWSMLGARPVTMVAWESFGAGWVLFVKQMKLEADVRTAEYGEIVDMAAVGATRTLSSHGTAPHLACMPNGDAIPADRQGLTICDATSAAFTMDLPWDKLDVTTFSWQKVLGGEAAHGMLILSPVRSNDWRHTPAWPLQEIFRLTKGGKLKVFSLAKQLIRHLCWRLRITSQHWIGPRMLEG